MTILAKDPARFVETVIDEETVIMLLDSGDFFSLSETGRAIWQLIDGQRDRAALLAALSAEYDVPVEVLAPDLDDFLVDLRTAGLLAAG